FLGLWVLVVDNNNVHYVKIQLLEHGKEGRIVLEGMRVGINRVERGEIFQFLDRERSTDNLRCVCWARCGGGFSCGCLSHATTPSISTTDITSIFIVDSIERAKRCDLTPVKL